MTHVLLSRQTSRYGGRKSAGREKFEPTELHHWTTAELAEQVAELERDGWYLTVTVLAYRDERREIAKRLYPAICCEECERL